MSKSKTFTVKYRRRREGTTNYKKRLKLLLGEKARLVLRKSNKNMIAQVAEYDPKGDKILITCTTRNLKKYGWENNTGNLPSAYLLGLLVGKMSKKKGINEMILDLGLQKAIKGSNLFAALKGAVDAGVDIPHSDDILPSEDRIKGKHIEESKKVPITKKFEEVKKNISGA